MSREYYAHSLPDRPVDHWQRLTDHLRSVAEKAGEFADVFHAPRWAYLAGTWHDIGKYSHEFQGRIRASDPDAHIENVRGRLDHSTAGAQHAYKALRDSGKLLAYTIAGHHAGLADGRTSDPSCLVNRLKKKVFDYSAAPPDILACTKPPGLPFGLDSQRAAFQLSFFTRMLYSCLVDADFLDTEKFLEPEKSDWRNGYQPLSALFVKLKAHMDRLQTEASPTKINTLRRGIFESCLEAADRATGLFSLTVPTGGGKTLASLGFALKHAVAHGLRRIIYVIPYTSIIEQNGAVFRGVLGDNAVVEHHSNFEPDEEDHRSRLAAENWDAPVIVTTNVQFFESLFASRSSRCRKLHNIAGSVVILDEAQMLPVPLLRPCLEALKELVASYRATVVLCTATQPALSRSEEFREGLVGVREIMSDPAELYRSFKKVDVSYLSSQRNVDIAARLTSHRQALCICNTRKHAREVFELIQNEKAIFHLSALMCPAHRSDIIAKIKKALTGSLPCRLVSTQLIEAGVDIDFPVVFRSLAGIDSIAQAAGRCNREGRLPENGQLYVFFPEAGLPPGYLRQTAETAQEVMRQNGDLLSAEAVEAYFRSFYWTKGDKLDEFQILSLIGDGIKSGDYPFHEVAKRFQIIKDGMEPIIIPWNSEAEDLITHLRYGGYPSFAARKLQRFTIQVPPRVLNALRVGGAVERLHDQYNVLLNKDIYRDDLGLCPEDPTFHEIESLIQ